MTPHNCNEYDLRRRLHINDIDALSLLKVNIPLKILHLHCLLWEVWIHGDVECHQHQHYPSTRQRTHLITSWSLQNINKRLKEACKVNEYHKHNNSKFHI